MQLVIKSASSGKSYTITKGQDGVVYCTCPAWKFQNKPVEERVCKHFDQAIAELSKTK